MPKLLMAGPHPLQKTTPLSNISRGFSTCAQKPVLWTTLQSCFFAYLAFTKGACALLVLHFLVFGANALLSMIPSPNVPSYAKHKRYQPSIVWLSVLTALDT